MSRLWRNPLRIALGPARVDLVRLGRLRGVAAKQSEACATHDWRGAVAALAKLLQPQRGSAVTLVLSNHFARYAVVPWSDAVSNPDELQALAQLRCTQVYGALAHGWEIRVSQGGFGASMLACGIEREFLDALRKVCHDADVRLDSIQPGLMAVFNRWRGQVKPDGWFVQAEPGRLTLALLRHGGWQAVMSRQAPGALGEVLPGLLAQENLLAGVPDVPQQAWLFAPEQVNFAAANANGWNLRQLRLPARPGFSPLNDGGYALAMCGGS